MRSIRRFRCSVPATALLVAGLFLIPGCGDSPPAEEALPTPEPAEPAPADPMAGMTHAEIELREVNGSGVRGEAMAMHDDATVIVMIEVEGLPAEGEYAAHIHQGSCEDGGPVAVPLNPVLGEADGTGSSTTTLDADEISADERQFIQVHGEGGTPIACGDIEGHGPNAGRPAAASAPGAAHPGPTLRG